MIGTKLAHYEITAHLGSGGMGDVYQATDLKLKRSVAIKLLPDTFASDADRLSRFRREAQLLASLNHPNIAHIYGLEESGDKRCIVMELVEGETVQARLKRGPIPVEEALAIAKQICEALEAAHEKGVIHRDLKPGNVMLTGDGRVKVLDFGLAKAFDRNTSNESLSNSPTLMSGGSMPGVILGTAAYMSPEQAKGRAVDRRTDIFAFGCVLYEMLTGHPVFGGEDVADILSAVMKSEPDWTLLPTNVQPRIRELLQVCLEKNLKSRLRDAGDVLIDIEQAQKNPETGTTPATTRTSRWPWAVTTVLLAVALGVALWAPWRVEKPADRPLVRLDVDLGADAAFPAANLAGSSIAISPDGTRLAYLSGTSGTPTKLFTRRLDQPKATELSGTQGAAQPFFSPDGQWVGFFANGKVNKISVEGGAVVPLGETSSFRGASWAEDGSIFVSEVAGRGLLQFPAAGGPPKIVAPLGNGELALAVPQLLPGGKAILFASTTSGAGGADASTIEVLTLADGRRKILVRGGQSPHYLPTSNGTGHLVYINKATLFAISFDLATLETHGTAVPVLDDVANSTFSGTGNFDISRTGAFIYRRSRGGAAALMTLQWIDSTGKKEPLLAKAGAYQRPRLSPDGKRIAFEIREGTSEDVWVYDPQRDAITRLTFGDENIDPAWSPDGQYVVFAKVNQGIFQARADGASPPQALTGSKTNQVPWSFTPDGKRLAYYEIAGNSQIWTVPLEDESGRLKAGKPEQFLKSNFQDQVPSFSPDGRWLAYHSNESGNSEVYVRAFPPPSSGQGGKWQISNNGGVVPRWSRTGHELVYQSGGQLMSASYSVKGDTFVAEKPRVWIAALGGAPWWDLAPDGKRVALAIPEASAQAPQQEHEIVMLLNFFDELRRRVPLGK